MSDAMCEEGRQEGRQEGLADGCTEGRLIGQRVAVDFRSKIEFYRGVAEAYDLPGLHSIPDKARRALQAMKDLLSAIPLDSLTSADDVSTDAVDFAGYLERLKSKAHMVAVALDQPPISIESAARKNRSNDLSF